MTKLSHNQVETMFAVLDKEKNKELRTLDLEYVNLSTVDPDVLARVVVKLKIAHLGFTKLTPHQVETLFAVLDNEKNTELHTLGLSRANLSTVEPDVLARVLDRLKNVALYDNLLTTQQRNEMEKGGCQLV